MPHPCDAAAWKWPNSSGGVFRPVSQGLPHGRCWAALLSNQRHADLGEEFFRGRLVKRSPVELQRGSVSRLPAASGEPLPTERGIAPAQPVVWAAVHRHGVFPAANPLYGTSPE